MSEKVTPSIDYPHRTVTAGKYEIAMGDSEVRLRTASGWHLITNRLILALVAELAGWESEP